MAFEKDVFISYAHIDDEAVKQDEKGWITSFHKSLEVRLSQLLGFKPEIWRDSRLQGNSDYTPDILNQLEGMKVMISVITPRYLNSKWCKDEVETFFEVANKDKTVGISVENKTRVFKLIKTPVTIEALPKKLQTILDYKFYKEDTTSNSVREFNPLLGEEYKTAYWNKFEDVANDISKLILKINALSGNANADESDNNNKKRTIYLAETTNDLNEYRDDLKRELISHDFIVLPDKNLTAKADAFESEVKAYMEKSSLSIHLVGSSYGNPIAGSTKTDVVIQNEIAADRSKEQSLSRLIWISPTSVAKDEKALEDKELIAFTKQLKTKENLLHQSDLLQGTLEEFKFAIFDTIRKLDAAEKKSAKRIIYLAEAAYDLKEHRDNLKRELIDKGYNVVPDKNLTLVADSYKNEVVRYMSQSTLSIHLMGKSYGVIPADATKSDVALQFEIAAEQRASRNLKRLIWTADNVSDEDERVDNLIEKLNEKDDLLQGSIDEFKVAIFDTIAKLDAEDKAIEDAKIAAAKAAEELAAAKAAEAKKASATVSIAEPVASNAPKNIYIICDKRDMDDTKPLEDFLYDSGFDFMFPDFDMDKEMIDAHEEKLAMCDAVVIYYGNGNDAWVIKKINELNRKPGLPNPKPLLASILYKAAEPANTNKERFRSRDIKVADSLKGFESAESAEFTEFIQKLK